MNMLPTRIILISSVKPESTTGGETILHRHLVNNPEIELIIYHKETKDSLFQKLVVRTLDRISKTRFHRWAQDIKFILSQVFPQKISHIEGVSQKTVVMTVAHGNLYNVARIFAEENGLPLVTFVHDWWPDMVPLHAPIRGILEQRFRDLYQQSQLALCVSEGMRMELGSHPNAQLLYPIPSKVTQLPETPKRTNNLKVLYFGNLYEYGPMVAEALQEVKGHTQIRMEARGANPNWPDPFRCEMAHEGMWHDFASVEVLQSWIESADAFLVPMVFDPRMRRRMETSFPSKMVEMAQFGRPLVIWGPEYCSAVRWGRQGNRSLCVTDPDPSALRKALELLATLPDEQQRLAAAARIAAHTEFNPDVIQKQFMGALHEVICTGDHSYNA
jgi:glycosyltransferase involved in cell wall biosynthesis